MMSFFFRYCGLNDSGSHVVMTGIWPFRGAAAFYGNQATFTVNGSLLFTVSIFMHDILVQLVEGNKIFTCKSCTTRRLVMERLDKPQNIKFDENNPVQRSWLMGKICPRCGDDTLVEEHTNPNYSCGVYGEHWSDEHGRCVYCVAAVKTTMLLLCDDRLCNLAPGFARNVHSHLVDLLEY
jgi:ribosomal protein S27AE